MPGTAISFDGNDLQTASILTQDIPHHGGPDKSAQDFPLAHANLSSIPLVNYPGKTITITGQLVASSFTAMDSLEDTFKAYFSGQDKNLDIGFAGSTRRYTATAQAVNVERPGGLLYANFSVQFRCTQPFGQDVSATTALTATARTLSGYSDAFVFTGTAPGIPTIATFTYTALTGGAAASVIFGNSSTGQAITVTRTWIAGDVLVVNSLTGKVTVNGIAIDFSGAFPKFAPGSTNMTYNDTLTTRTFNVAVTYNALWF